MFHKLQNVYREVTDYSNSIRKLDRREFIKLTGAASSGLMLGGLLSACGKEQETIVATSPAEPAAPPPVAADNLTMNLFVQIDTEGYVTIIAHRSEMGQGVRTSLPQIVADELEADWDKVRIKQGLGNKAYGSQNTDGSRSVRRFYTKMRQMGATAKQMLIAAAATQWNVPIEECSAQSHQVIHKASGKSAGYGELAKAASDIPVPAEQDLKLKDKSEFKYIGKAIGNVDLPAIIKGKAQYGLDITLPDMLYASVVRCPVLGGKLKSFDDTATRKVQGVVDVVTIEGTPGPAVFHAPAGVAVIASNTWAAMKGRNQLRVEWDLGEHASHSSDSYLQELKQNIKEKGEVIRERGSVDKAFDEAASIVEAEYTTPYLPHAAMEPLNATAQYSDTSCEIWAPTQHPQGLQDTVAGKLGLTAEQIKVNITLLGGAFGRKAKHDFAVEAATLSKKLNGKPIQVVWTREDDMQSDYYQAISAQRYKAALNAENEITAWNACTAFPSIVSIWNAEQTKPHDFEVSLGFTDIPYDIPNIRCERQTAVAHTRIGWLRSVSNIQHAFGVGSFIDEVARAAGKDQREFLLETIGPDRDIDISKEKANYFNYEEDIKVYRYQTARLKNVIKRVCKNSGWDYKHKQKKNVGLGIAAHYSFLTYMATAVRLRRVNTKIIIENVYCTLDCGRIINPDRVLAQVEGAIIMGLSQALYGEITFKDGAVEQSNFHDFRLMRINESPQFIIEFVNSDAAPTGIGEPGVPPVAPALVNAIVDSGGPRIRDLPITKYLLA